MNIADKNKKNKKKISFFEMLFHGATFNIFMVFLVASIIFGFKVYAQEKNTNVSVSGLTNVKIGDTIQFNFSSKMLQRSIEGSMSIEPEIKIKVDWEGSRVVKLTLLESPIPGTKYLIKIKGAKTQFFIPQKKIEKEFTASSFPGLKAIYPKNEQADVETLDHIIIDFNQTLEDPYNVEVKITPATTEFQHKFNEAKTQLVITPLSKLDKKTEYSVAVKLRHKYLDLVKEVYSGKFTTKLPSLVVYNYGDGNTQKKTEERKEDVEPQILKGRYIDVDLSSQTMFIFEDGEEKGAFKVSTGKRGMDTPNGTFKVMGKAKRPWSKTYKLYMPWFIQFTGEGHGIHELPEWPSGYKEGTNHLGIPVSHGCVRLGIGTAKIVYDFVTVGTPLVIHQ